MYGVIRFLDTPQLPASAPDDYPKVIQSGIDEEGQHPKSPPITGAAGIATLIYRIGRPQLLEKLLDVENIEEFDMRVRTEDEFLDDVYVRRRGREVEIGFIDHEGRFAQHGVRYRIEKEPIESPYQFSKWTPLSTSDQGQPWGGTENWVRAQGAAIAKAIWWNNIFDFPHIDVTWVDISDSERKDLDAWLKDRAARLEDKKKAEDEEFDRLEKKLGSDAFHKYEEEMDMQKYYKSRLACRAQCGEQKPKMTCSKCKTTRYCSKKCQEEDWKYHKTYCGTEDAIPQKYLELAE